VTFQGVTTAHTFRVGSLVDAPSDDVAGGRLALALRGAHPRPGPVELEAFLPSAGIVRLAIADARGRTVARLADGWRPAGRHVFRWDAAAPPGIYLARLSGTRDAAVVRKVVLPD
jgi:hypothetical protein